MYPVRRVKAFRTGCRARPITFISPCSARIPFATFGRLPSFFPIIYPESLQTFSTPLFPAFISESYSLFTVNSLDYSGLPRCHRFGFIRCKGRLPRLMRRFEVHSLQILPSCKRVIGRENHRIKFHRQPCAASINPKTVQAEKGNRKEGKTDVSHIKKITK